MAPATCDIRPKRFDALLSIAFLLALAAPWIDKLARPDSARDPSPELREAAKMPDWPRGLWSLSVFPEKTEKHFNDTFGLRDWLLRWHSIVQVFGFQESATSHMAMGKDRWLFLTLDHSVPIYRGIEPLTDKDIARWLELWEARRDYLAKRGIQYLFVLAPNKETIYPERVRSRYNKVGPTRLEQIVEALKARPDLPVIELRDALRAEKQGDTPGDYTYAELGTHWNGRGYYAAYRAIAEALRARFPAIEPVPREELLLLTAHDHGDTWAARMYIDDLLTQVAKLYVPPLSRGIQTVVSFENGRGQQRAYTQSRDDLPRGVILHDSFGGVTNELISTNFAALACEQLPYFDVDFIARAHPDIVIELHVERVLYTWPFPQKLPDEIDSDERAFESSQHELFRLDVAQASQTLRPAPGTQFEFEVDDAPRATIRSDAGPGRFYVDPVAASGAQREDAHDVIVRAEIETRQSGCLQVFFQPEGDTQYARTKFRWALLDAGRNTVYLRFAASEMKAPLYFTIVGSQSAYALHALAARAVDVRAKSEL